MRRIHSDDHTPDPATDRPRRRATDSAQSARTPTDVGLRNALTAGNRASAATLDHAPAPAAMSPAIASAITADDRPNRVHRHASWEHKMLGDIDPDVLEIISSGQDVAGEERKKKSLFQSTRDSAKTIRDDKNNEISIDTVLHTIDQEIRRLKFFKDVPPSGTVDEATAALRAQDAKSRGIDSSEWDIRLVELTLSDGTQFLLTYGEMNTMADFYGSRQELALAPAKNFRGIVGGVREESYRKFMRLRNDLTVTGKKQYDPDAKKHHFEGAIGNRGESYKVLGGDAYGELKLMGIMGKEERAPIPGKEETTYVGGLARNACHFAPHSWHAWGKAHVKAEGLAREAAALKARMTRIEQMNQDMLDDPDANTLEMVRFNDRTIVRLEGEAAAKQNEALIENGFADHFLQDSYAAGHLIDKSLIMQWFAKWLDQRGRKRDYSTEEQWRRIQQIAYGQPDLAGTDLYDTGTVGQQQSNDPQSVENLDGDWTVRFAALGLKVPRSLTDPNTDAWKLFTWWQGHTIQGHLETTDAKQLAKISPIKDVTRVQTALKVLIEDGVVYYKWYSTKDRNEGPESIGLGSKSLRIKKEYIPKDKDKFRASVKSAKEGDPSDYIKQAKAVTYGDYHTFLNHGYLQLSSNILHDHFCANGLDVATARGDTPYRIYGDNAMLGKDSAKMVKYSAETSRQSRDSIYEIAATGNTLKTTTSIAARFPTFVKPKGANANLSLQEWHGNDGALRKFCDETVFDRAAAVFSKSTVAAKSELAEQVSKDAVPQVHVGEAF